MDGSPDLLVEHHSLNWSQTQVTDKTPHVFQRLTTTHFHIRYFPKPPVFQRTPTWFVEYAITCLWFVENAVTINLWCQGRMPFDWILLNNTACNHCWWLGCTTHSLCGTAPPSGPVFDEPPVPLSRSGSSQKSGSTSSSNVTNPPIHLESIRLNE